MAVVFLFLSPCRIYEPGASTALVSIVSYQWKVQDNGSHLHFIASIIPFGQCSIEIRKYINPSHPLMTRSQCNRADGLLRVVCLKMLKMKIKWEHERECA